MESIDKPAKGDWVIWERLACRPVQYPAIVIGGPDRFGFMIIEIDLGHRVAHQSDLHSSRRI